MKVMLLKNVIYVASQYIKHAINIELKKVKTGNAKYVKNSAKIPNFFHVFFVTNKEA